MKLIKLSLVAAVLVTGMISAQASEVGVSANMALTSNYVWRGMTQTHESPAIQGGVDVDYMGVYAGVWASNISWTETVESSLETDLYLGYANEISGFSYDLGFIAYTYANVMDEMNFGEAYVGLGYDFGILSVGAAYALGVSIGDTEDIPDNIEATISVPLPAEITIDAAYGMYDTVGDYYSVSASRSFGKFDFSLGYSGIAFEDSAADDEGNFIVSVATSF